MLRNVRGPEIKLVDEKNAHLFAHIDTLSSSTATKEIPPRTPFAGLMTYKLQESGSAADHCRLSINY